MRLTIAYSKIKKQNLVLINNDTHQRETLSERPIRPPLMVTNYLNLHEHIPISTKMNSLTVDVMLVRRLTNNVFSYLSLHRLSIFKSKCY